MSSLAQNTESSMDETETICSVLEEFGFGRTDQSVFLALLEHGSRPASTIAKYAGVSRAHIYGILDKLVDRGLVSINEKNGVRHYAPLSLYELAFSIKQKEEALASRREYINQLSLAKQCPSNSLWSDPLSKLYRGDEARARIFQELVRGDQEELVLVCSATNSLIFEQGEQTKEHLLQLIQLVTGKLKIVLFSPNDKAWRLVRECNSPAICVSSNIFKAEMVISDSKVTLVGMRNNVPCTIIMEQPALAANFRSLLTDDVTSYEK